MVEVFVTRLLPTQLHPICLSLVNDADVQESSCGGVVLL
jgi:hypothetical protein